MSKKLFISADIEGTAGICNWSEAEKGGDLYEKFAALMTAEVAAAAQAALDLGWEVTIKDAHDSARNIDPEKLPAGCRLIRGWTGEPLCMMAGLETGHFDAAAYTGYHADAFSSGNPLAHTMTPSAHRVTLNGSPASEFTLNAYAAAELGVPSVFLSGDAALCRDARAFAHNYRCPHKNRRRRSRDFKDPRRGLPRNIRRHEARTAVRSRAMPAPPSGAF